MKSRHLGRRGLLKSAGLTLPMLESVVRGESAVAEDSRRSDSQPPTAQRLICVGSNLGLYRPAFYPKQTGRDYELSLLLQPLADHRDDLTVFSGFDHRAGNGHANWDNYLCGNRIGDVSLDQVAAAKIGGATRFESLQLCAGDTPKQRMVYSDRGVPLPMANRPSAVFQKLFATAESRDRTEYLLKSGQSSIDVALDDAKQIRRRVSVGDQHKLDEYFTALRELETRMTRQLTHLADETAKVDYELPAYDPMAPTLMLECEQIMFDLMALALQTDSTRVATLFIAGLGQVFTLDGQTLRAGYHALSHHGNDPDLIRDLIRVEVEHMKCLARFLSQLKQRTDERGRPLLDSTLVMFGTGMGDASRHSNRDLPTLVAGGGMNHGTHITSDPNDEDSLLLGDVFVQMLNKMGVETGTFSNAKHGLSDWS